MLYSCREKTPGNDPKLVEKKREECGKKEKNKNTKKNKSGFFWGETTGKDGFFFSPSTKSFSPSCVLVSPPPYGLTLLFSFLFVFLRGLWSSLAPQLVAGVTFFFLLLLLLLSTIH